MVATPLLMGAPKVKPMTLWHYLAVFIVSLWKALAMIFLFRNVFVYYNASTVDHIIEECTQENPDELQTDNYMCHYMSLWIKYFHLSHDDLRGFVHNFLLLTIIFSLHFIVSSFILLMGGVVRGNHLSYVPWLVTMLMMIMILTVLILGEVALTQGENSAIVKLGCSGTYLILILVFAIVSWILVLTACLQNKQSLERTKVHSRERRFDYYRFF
ncbi:uncharacterized protein LOC131887999 [Tigriopus californicus]|nr:uncharacterized protein LOC131887999 [Tigriopus californicus]